jgi:G3E family GTPase
VTVLGGYLGSGKTTRLNHLLHDFHNLRIAVVVNDFGTINIDASLVRAQAGQMIELSNGCICCSLSDGMTSVMRQIADLKPRPQRLLIEVSGVGNPAAVMAWAQLPGFEASGTVVCVDATSIQEQANSRWVSDTIIQQIRSADLLLLTKTDLISSDASARIRSWLGTIAPDAPVYADATVLRAMVESPNILARRPTSDDTPISAHAHAAYTSWSGQTRSLVDLQAMLRFLACLDDEVIRAKGILRTVDDPQRRTVVQQVGRQLDVADGGEWDDDDDLSQLVLIAPGAAESLQGLPQDIMQAVAHILG